MERIGIYVGSFDPFHIGHYEVAKVALQYVDKVIIVPNNPCKSKIYRTDLHHRIQMIKLSIHNNPQILVSDESITTLNDVLYDRYYCVGLIGNDQCHKEPKTKVHEWIIVDRVPNNTKVSWSVPTRLLPKELFYEQNGSSTNIRHKIMTN